MLENSSKINKTGVGFYNWIQKHCPLLHTGVLRFVELLSYLNRDSVHLGRGYYTQVLQEYRPHLIFSVHDCLNRGYFQLARKILGADKVRCATYCGEFSGGWGYSRNWIEPSTDLYFTNAYRPRLCRETWYSSGKGAGSRALHAPASVHRIDSTVGKSSVP